MRQITITCIGNSAVANSYYAGYQGEHNATRLAWRLPAELQSYNYILAFALPDGTAESVIIDKYPITYTMSQTITQLAGTVTVQLTVLNGDELIYKTQQVQLHITNSVNIDNTAKPYASELTQAIEQFVVATKSLGNIAISAERKDGGVTVSVTDKDNNTSTCNIYDGSDYVLTDTDRQDIAAVVAGELSDKLDDKQDKLISGTNLKTINNQPLLGEGNITIGGGEKELTRKVVTTTEEVSEIFLETDDFDVCYINVITNSGTCKYKIIYHNTNAPSNFNDYVSSASSTAQYGNYHKIEKQPSTLNYKYNAFRLTPSGNVMISYETTRFDTQNGIILKSVAEGVPFPVGSKIEIYYK